MYGLGPGIQGVGSHPLSGALVFGPEWHEAPLEEADGLDALIGYHGMESGRESRMVIYGFEEVPLLELRLKPSL